MSRVRRPGPPARSVAALLLAGAALAAAPAWAAWTAGPRAVDLAPDRVPTSGAQVDALRLAKRALPADSPLLRIDSAVQDRVSALARTNDPRRRSVVADVVAAFDTPLVAVDEIGRAHV